MHRISSKIVKTLALSIGILFAATAMGPLTSASAASAKPLIKITSYGGFVMPGTDQSNIPAMQISESGLALWPNPNPSRWDVRFALSRQLDVPTTIKLIANIAEAGKKPAAGWGFPGVADVPNTRIQISTAHMHRVINIYALAFSNGNNLSAEQVAARKKLNAAVNRLTSFVARGKSANYVPNTYEAWNGMALVMMGDGSDKAADNGTGLANPASVFCVAMGGTLVIKDSGDGQTGVCTLPDGSSVEEWTYFRTEGPKLGQWPSGVTPPKGACTAVPATKLAKEIKRKNESGLWLMPGGSVLRLVIRPVLPGETACSR